MGRGVAVSPVVTVEPRRRKFHKAITLSMPAPRAHSQGMINQYSGSAPTLRLLCSITGTYLTRTKHKTLNNSVRISVYHVYLSLLIIIIMIYLLLITEKRCVNIHLCFNYNLLSKIQKQLNQNLINVLFLINLEMLYCKIQKIKSENV